MGEAAFDHVFKQKFVATQKKPEKVGIFFFDFEIESLLKPRTISESVVIQYRFRTGKTVYHTLDFSNCLNLAESSPPTIRRSLRKRKATTLPSTYPQSKDHSKVMQVCDLKLTL